MHKKYVYTSVFAELITDYIKANRDAGFLYDNPSYWLYRFDQYCDKNSITETIITKELYEKWSAKFSTESKTTQNNRLQAIRKFSTYLNILGIPSYIPKILPKPEKIVPYLMTDSDIKQFFEQLDARQNKTNVKAFKRLEHEYKVIFRLIYSCGLRNNEACSLKLENVNLDNGTLEILHSKGNKNRIIYLSEDMKNLCKDYLSWLYLQLTYQSIWLFPGKSPEKHIPKTSLDKIFNEIWYKTEASKYCDKKPTVHCFRHAYVIKRINLWMKSDVSLNVMMPYLSSFLGHSSPAETYYYYHQIEDIFETIRKRDIVSDIVIPEVDNYEK